MERRDWRGRASFQKTVVNPVADACQNRADLWSHHGGSDFGVQRSNDAFQLRAVKTVGGNCPLERLDPNREREAVSDVFFVQSLQQERSNHVVRRVLVGGVEGLDGEEGGEFVENGVDADEPVLVEVESLHDLQRDASNHFVQL